MHGWPLCAWKVQVFPYDKEGDESSYLVNDTIKAGDVRAVEPVQ